MWLSSASPSRQDNNGFHRLEPFQITTVQRGSDKIGGTLNFCNCCAPDPWILVSGHRNKKCAGNAMGGGGHSILFQHGCAAGPPATLSVGEGGFVKSDPWWGRFCQRCLHRLIWVITPNTLSLLSRNSKVNFVLTGFVENPEKSPLVRAVSVKSDPWWGGFWWKVTLGEGGFGEKQTLGREDFWKGLGV